ncbi:putative Longin domain-containing protein [Rosa chinensis]|uniref:Putative Longin domain-containing protein n=1 Tax=Rosa chinensis TaxID=74649 RepID=A0A2P6SH92_ROSCH|nr:putative Longin domain-containing protein [Rosa chinensis]
MLAYCVVAVEALGRQVPIAFLEPIKEDFTKRYGVGKAATAAEQGIWITKLANVKAQVSEVKGVMMESIEKVLDRGEKIELLVDKTRNAFAHSAFWRMDAMEQELLNEDTSIHGIHVPLLFLNFDFAFLVKSCYVNDRITI